MNLYRVVPNSIICRDRRSGYLSIDETSFIGAEDLYYNMGYTSFIDEVDTSGKDLYTGLTTVPFNKDEKNKFFYLYPDEALQNASSIINYLGNKVGATYCLLVYDFPLDLILKHIGYGNYEGKRRPYALETNIDINDFGTDVLDSSKIESKEKQKVLISFFQQSLLTEADTFLEYSMDTLDELLKYLNKYGNQCLVKINDLSYASEIIQNSKLYHNFLDYNGPVVQNNHITGKNIPINVGWYNRNNNFGGDKFVQDFFASHGINVTLDSESYKQRDEIIEQINREPQDKDKIGKLLIKTTH